MARMVTVLLLFVVNALVAFFGAAAILSEQYAVLFEIMVSFSSAVFAISGVWLAIVFPGVLTGLYEGVGSLADRQALLEKASRLLYPLFLAAFVALVSFLARLAIPLTEAAADYFSLAGAHFKQAGLFLVLSLSELLVVSLLLALAPGLQLIANAKLKLLRKRRRYRLLSNNKKTGSG